MHAKTFLQYAQAIFLQYHVLWFIARVRKSWFRLPLLCLVIALWLFLMMGWVGLQCVIVWFPDHTHLFFGSENRLDIVWDRYESSNTIKERKGNQREGTARFKISYESFLRIDENKTDVFFSSRSSFYCTLWRSEIKYFNERWISSV